MQSKQPYGIVIVRQAYEIEDLPRLWNDPYAGELSIGAFPSLASCYFPQILDHCVETDPQLRVNLVEGRTHVLIERLKAGTLDGAFLTKPVDEEALVHGAIFSEELLTDSRMRGVTQSTDSL